VQRHKEHADNDIETSSVPVVAESKNCCCLGPEVLPNEDHFEVQDISGLALLKITEFWLLWGTEFIVVGVSLMWKNHVGMFGFPESYTGRLVMVWVAVNAGARFVTGAASDWLRAVFARTGFFLIGMLYMCFDVCLCAGCLTHTLALRCVYIGCVAHDSVRGADGGHRVVG
jgi:hypothetical protein